MKKTIAVIVVLVFLSSALFAQWFVDGSLGFAYLSAKVTTKLGEESTSMKEKTSALSTDASFMFFPGESRFGADLGISVLFPISMTMGGVDIDIDFFDCDICPRIGLAWKADLNNSLVMLSSVGYEVMMDFGSETNGIVTVKTRSFVHGVYAQDRLVYKMNSNVRINAGLSLYFPIFGTMTEYISGTETKRKTNFTFSGILINPFIGIDIKTK